MTLETFFAKFDQFAGAPDAVAKMRELVRHLAVTGKLIAQDPSDKPADKLIAQIAEHRRATNAKEYQPVTADGAPYELPISWSWVRLGNISLTSDSGWSPQCLPEARTGTEWGVLKVSAVSWGVFKPEENKALPPGMTSRPDCEVKAGDFLLSRANTEELVARSVVVDQTPPRLMMSDKIVRFTFTDEIERAFINLANSSVHSRAYYSRNASGTSSSMKNIGREVMCNLPIPLPPLAEQKRIVAKVDELMALCDRLEAQQQERETRHAALARASLARFADAPTPANLPFLFHPSYAIPPADLRKSILTLAVQGKLVPQDPNDEPAETVNLKLPKQLRAIADKVGARFTAPTALVEASDDLPPGWGTAAIQSIGITQTGTTPSKSESSFTGRDIPFIKPGDIQGDVIDYDNEGLSADGLSAGRLIPQHSVLMVSIGGSIGKTAIVSRDVSCNQQINSVTPAECVEPRFVLTAIRSGVFQAEVMSRAAQGTLPIISKGKWETIRIPIPPHAEQRRIVAKVDQLMALVDALETQLAASRATAANLLEALVAELTTA